MSRFEKMSLPITEGVEVTLTEEQITVKGSKGSMAFQFPKNISMEKKDDQLKIVLKKKSQQDIAFAGLTYRSVQNNIIGVSKGFEKKLFIKGVGYRWNVDGKKLKMQVGFSHDTEFDIPKGIEMKVDKENTLTVSSFNKQLVGQVAAEVKSFRPIEPYKGKGISIEGQHVIKKAGKSGAKT